MPLDVTILGCGSSGGVPRIGGDWGNCDPANPRNRRRRCALLVERRAAGGDGEATTVLVDTGPDMREQLLEAGVHRLDAVLYTHPHADHIHGIDDLRGLALAARRRIPVYADESTSARLMEAFRYCFVAPPGSEYPPILDLHGLTAGHLLTIDGPGGPVPVLPFRQTHGAIDALGFRFGDLAYSSDINDLPEESEDRLKNLDVWIVDALRRSRHSSHFTLDQALDWIERIRPRRAILTNMHQDLDYETLRRTLPPGVEPAYDMMHLRLPDPAPEATDDPHAIAAGR